MQLKKIAFTLLIGAAAAMTATSPSFAAKKKAKAAEPNQAAQFCFQNQPQVCATRGGMKMTYANACFATRDGATVVSNGACKPAKMAMKKGGKKKMKMKKM